MFTLSNVLTDFSWFYKRFWLIFCAFCSIWNWNSSSLPIIITIYLWLYDHIIICLVNTVLQCFRTLRQLRGAETQQLSQGPVSSVTSLWQGQEDVHITAVFMPHAYCSRRQQDVKRPVLGRRRCCTTISDVINICALPDTYRHTTIYVAKSFAIHCEAGITVV